MKLNQWLALLFAVSMVMALSGCGKDDTKVTAPGYYTGEMKKKGTAGAKTGQAGSPAGMAAP